MPSGKFQKIVTKLLQNEDEVKIQIKNQKPVDLIHFKTKMKNPPFDCWNNRQQLTKFSNMLDPVCKI